MNRYGVIALLVLLAGASAMCGAVHEPVISSALGTRSIAAGSDAALAQAPNGDESSYAYLVLERIPTPLMRAELIVASADDYDIVCDADIGGVSGVTLTFSQGATITVAPDCCIDVGSTGTIVGAQNALQGEYYTVDLYTIGSLNKIGGRAEFVGASSAPCGTVYSSKNIVLANANMTGCSRDYTAEDDIVIEDGNTIGNGTILTVN